MRRAVTGLLSLGAFVYFLATANAQPPRGPDRPPERDGAPPPPPPPPPGPLFEALDKNHDGVLSNEEILGASESLKTLDKNGDGKLTPDELHPHGGPGRPPGRGPEGAGPRERREGRPERGREDRRPPGPREGRREDPGPPGPRGPGFGRPGFGGPGPDGPGRGGPPSVLPPFIRDELRLTEEQQKQLDELDADVRAKLDKILTAEQKQELQHAHRRGPGGPPPRDGGPAGRGRGRPVPPGPPPGDDE